MKETERNKEIEKTKNDTGRKNKRENQKDRKKE